MDANKNDHPDLPEALSSAEYRSRLLTKLNCLVAVLEVAIGKIAKSMDVPGANEERLLKIRSNLENTLAICNRARETLERSGTGSATRPAVRDRRSAADKSGMTARDYVELSSIEEYRKFRNMPPIAREELGSLDLDDLARRLSES